MKIGFKDYNIPFINSILVISSWENERLIGAVRRRALQELLQSASALNIIINAITIWNCVYLNKAIDYLKRNGGFDESLLNNISPLGWKHINFLGEYKFNSNQNRDLKDLNL